VDEADDEIRSGGDIAQGIYLAHEDAGQVFELPGGMPGRTEMLAAMPRMR
jgi:hypothetical protein